MKELWSQPCSELPKIHWLKNGHITLLSLTHFLFLGNSPMLKWVAGFAFASVFASTPFRKCEIPINIVWMFRISCCYYNNNTNNNLIFFVIG